MRLGFFLGVFFRPNHILFRLTVFAQWHYDGIVYISVFAILIINT